MAIQKTEALILKTQPFRSSSLIVTFFSRSFGKLRGLVKGVRREGETRGALFEPFSHLEILFYEKLRSDLHLVSETSLVESHDAVRSSLEAIAHASYFSELVDELTEVHDPHEPVFDLLDYCFRFLPSLPGEKLSRVFEIKLLAEIGWLPYLDACVSCQNAPLEKGFFSVKQGALLCRNCAPEFGDAEPITSETLALMRYYARHEIEASLQRTAGKVAEANLGRLLNHFILFRLGKPFKSRQFLKQIQTTLR